MRLERGSIAALPACSRQRARDRIGRGAQRPQRGLHGAFRHRTGSEGVERAGDLVQVVPAPAELLVERPQLPRIEGGGNPLLAACEAPRAHVRRHRPPGRRCARPQARGLGVRHAHLHDAVPVPVSHSESPFERVSADGRGSPFRKAPGRAPTGAVPAIPARRAGETELGQNRRNDGYGQVPTSRITVGVGTVIPINHGDVSAGAVMATLGSHRAEPEREPGSARHGGMMATHGSHRMQPFAGRGRRERSGSGRRPHGSVSEPRSEREPGGDIPGGDSPQGDRARGPLAGPRAPRRRRGNRRPPDRTCSLRSDLAPGEIAGAGLDARPRRRLAEGQHGGRASRHSVPRRSGHPPSPVYLTLLTGAGSKYRSRSMTPTPFERLTSSISRMEK